ncbi:FAD-dependent monooxygenase [Thalassiella azotivora]
MTSSPTVGRPDRRAAVVGAGIGGLTTAVALQRAGWSVTVHERAAALEPLGAGLVLWPNAVHALDALGLGDAVREHAAVLGGTAIRRPDGRLLARTHGAALAARHGAPLLGIERGHLQTGLADALGPDAVRLGSDAVRLGSDVHDPHELAAEHDLVVGADGVRSRVRAALWPDLAEPAYAGYTAWRAVVRADVPVREVSETWGVRERFGVVPMADGRVYVFATATVPAGGATGSDEEVAELRRRFGRWHEPIPALLEALAPEAVLRHDVHALPTVPDVLHRGRAVLLGDAAHAMEPNLGQGACLAVEDAVVLAHELGEDADVHQALARYNGARRPRVAALSRLSARIGRVTQHTGPVGAAVRDTAARLTPRGVLLRGSDRAAGWRPPTPPPGGGAHPAHDAPGVAADDDRAGRR